MPVTANSDCSSSIFSDRIVCVVDVEVVRVVNWFSVNKLSAAADIRIQ